mgnify:CR=1 FL=1
MLDWQTLALRAARREVHSRRYFRRTCDAGLESYGAYLRRRKRDQSIRDSYQRKQTLSVVEANARGVGPEEWQDVYYGEMERFGEHAPTGVKERWAKEGAAHD